MIPGGIPDKPKVRRYHQKEEPIDIEIRLFNIGLIYIVSTFVLVFNVDTHKPFYHQNNAAMISVVMMVAILMALILKLVTDNTKIYIDENE